MNDTGGLWHPAALVPNPVHPLENNVSRTSHPNRIRLCAAHAAFPEQLGQFPIGRDQLEPQLALTIPTASARSGYASLDGESNVDTVMLPEVMSRTPN